MKKTFVFCLLIALLCPTLSAGSYLRVISWNTLHMGWSGQTDWNAYAQQMWYDFGTSSSSSNGFDVAFLQEVMYSSSLPSLVSALNSVSGFTWDYRVTSAVGRSSYKERYAVVFRTDRVSILDEYLYYDSGDVFEREPQVVRLRHKQTNADYTFINWHTIFGSTSQRKAEISAIATVFKNIQNSNSSDQDVILLGDHNRDATSNYWANLKSTSVVSPQVSYKVNSKTSINSSCSYASKYDHFWMQTSYVSEYSSSGLDYIGNLCTFRGYSDHAPIWMKLYSNSDTD